jgi:DNA-binding MarR family transcriptional regulator
MNEFDECPTEGALGLLTLLIKTGRLAESRLDEALASENLTFVKWRTLEALVKANSPVCLGELAKSINCVKSNVTQLADKLQAEGIVKRVADPNDRRSILIELTGQGSRVHQAGLKAMETTTRKLFSSSTEPDRIALRDLLGKLDGR